MRRRAWLIGSLVFFTPALASAATYVVAPGGDDGASGLAGAPWATLQHAADSVGPGDTVSVEPGSYAGFMMQTSGTKDAPITFSAKPGVLITTENDTTPDGINVESYNDETVAYVIIEGFTVNGMARSGIRTAVSSHITIRKNKTDQNGVWGILTGFADDVVIEDNECSRSQEQHGIYFSNSADRPIIRRNLVWGNAQNGLHMNGDAEQPGDGIISDALVESNIFHDNGGGSAVSNGGGSGINCDGVQNSRIQNNLIYDSHATGISLYQIDGGGPSTGNVVVNNTVLVASDGRWALNIRDGATGNHVYNNILWNAHPSRGAVTIAADALDGFLADNNLMLDRFTLDDGDTVIVLADWQSATGQDAASSTAEPTFVNPGAGDYHSQPASPAVDKGTATQAPGADLEGIARPQGVTFDIGAYEVCPSGDCESGTGGSGPGGGGPGGNGGAGGGNGGNGGNGGTAGGTAGNGGNAATGGNGGDGPGADGGCSCRTAGSGAPANEAGGLLLIGAALATSLSRRRRSRAPTTT